MQITPFYTLAALMAATLTPGICQAQSLVDQSEPVTIQVAPSAGGVFGLMPSAVREFLGMATDAAPETSADDGLVGAPANAGRDYTIQTASIASTTSVMTSTVALPGIGPVEEAPVCLNIEVPPRSLATKSKYNQADSSKSTIDEDALASRDKTVQPIRNAVRALTTLAYASSDDLGTTIARAECVLHNADRWAKAKSLTEMRTTDAYLSRDRWIAEIALAVRIAGTHVEISSERKALYADWFGVVAKDTIEAYSLRLGPKSRTNNHRYWAGLSVAAIGFLLNEDEFKTWGKMSFEIGACQVDGFGLLPTELARGEKALDYHVYALRPLAAIMKLSEDAGEPVQSKCLDGFQRLASRTRQALQDPADFEKLAGLRQKTTNQENSYSAALKLEALPIYQ